MSQGWARQEGDLSSLVFIGIEVSQARWDLAVRPGHTWSAPHEESALAALVEQFTRLRPTRVVWEAPDEGAVPLTPAVATAGLPVVGVHPRQVRDVARARGLVAKTDALEAQVLAPLAEVMRPPPRPLPDADARTLAALLTRGRHLVAMRTAEKNRLLSASASIRPSLRAHIAWLEREVERTDTELTNAIQQSPIWREHDEWWRSVPGGGPVLPSTRLANLPEWGTLTHPQIAALVGVAPLNRDRGTLRGRRTLGGGRAQGRAALSMRAIVAARFNPVIRTFSQRLPQAGKATKVGLTAWMRNLRTILNARMNHRTPWCMSEAQHV